jgi:hypothetical protein
MTTRISRVSKRSSPATSSGWASIARLSRSRSGCSDRCPGGPTAGPSGPIAAGAWALRSRRWRRPAQRREDPAVPPPGGPPPAAGDDPPAGRTRSGQCIWRQVARNAACLPEQLCSRGLSGTQGWGTAAVQASSPAPQRILKASRAWEAVPAVGGTGHRQTPVAAADPIRSAAGHEHGSLEGLEGGTNETQLLGITGAHQHPAPLVADHGVDPMDRLAMPSRADAPPGEEPRNAGSCRKTGRQAHRGEMGDRGWSAQRAWQRPAPPSSSSRAMAEGLPQPHQHRPHLVAGHQQILLPPGEGLLPHLAVVPAGFLVLDPLGDQATCVDVGPAQPLAAEQQQGRQHGRHHSGGHHAAGESWRSVQLPRADQQAVSGSDSSQLIVQGAPQSCTGEGGPGEEPGGTELVDTPQEGAGRAAPGRGSPSRPDPWQSQGSQLRQSPGRPSLGKSLCRA